MNLSHYAVYDLATGEIAHTAASTMPPAVVLESWPLAEGRGLARMPESLPTPQDHWWVVDGLVVARTPIVPTLSQTSFAADGVDACIITGLPSPCRVTVTGAVTAGPVEVSGGTLTLSSTQRGEIHLTVRADPSHTPWSTTIHAT